MKSLILWNKQEKSLTGLTDEENCIKEKILLLP